MARTEIFVGDVQITLPKLDDIKTELEAIESQVKKSVSSIKDAFDLGNVRQEFEELTKTEPIEIKVTADVDDIIGVTGEVARLNQEVGSLRQSLHQWQQGYRSLEEQNDELKQSLNRSQESMEEVMQTARRQGDELGRLSQHVREYREQSERATVFDDAMEHTADQTRRASREVENLSGANREVFDSIQNITQILDAMGEKVDKLSLRIENIGTQGGIAGVSISAAARAFLEFRKQFGSEAATGIQAYNSALEEFKTNLVAAGTTSKITTKQIAQVFLKGMTDSQETVGTANDAIERSFAALQDKLVGRSIVTDMMGSIVRLFSTLPDETAPHVRKLKDQFELIQKTVKFEKLDTEEEQLAIKALAKIMQALSEEVIAYTLNVKGASEAQKDFAKKGGKDFVRRTQAYKNAIGLTDDITSALKNLGDKGSVQVVRLNRRFRELNSSLKAAKDVESLAEAFSGLEEVQKDISNLTGLQERLARATDTEVIRAAGGYKEAIRLVGKMKVEFKELGDSGSTESIRLRERFNELNIELKKARSVEEISRAFEELRDVQAQLGSAVESQKTAYVESMRQMQAATTAVDEWGFDDIIQRVNRIDDDARKASSGFGNSIRNIRDGIALASADGGKLLGIRTAMFGVSGSTNLVAKSLDFMTGKLDKAGAAQDRLAVAGVRATRQLSDQAIRIRGNVDAIKDISKQVGFNTTAFNDMDRQITKLQETYLRMTTTIESSGKPTRQQLALIREAYRELQQEIGQVRARVGDQIPPEALAVLNKLEQDIKANVPATRSLALNLDKLSEKAKKSSNAQEELSDDTKKSASVFKRFTASIRGSFSFIIRGTRNIEEMNHEITRTGSVIRRTSDIARGAFRGAFGGTLLGNVLSDVFRNLIFGMRETGAEAVRLATDFAELESLFVAVFEGREGGEFAGLAANVEGQLTTISEVLGRSKADLMEFAAGFQDTFVPLGFARDQSADLSVALTALVSDVSSFKNVTEPEAAEAFTSALVGNHEAVRKFGIIITEASLSAKLLELGIADSSREASEQEKVMARLAIIMGSTKDAWDDASITADGYANRLRKVEGFNKDSRIELGLLLQQGLSPLLDLYIQLAQIVLPKLIGRIKEFGATFAPLFESISSHIRSGDISGAVDIVVDQVGIGIDNIFSLLNDFIPNAFDWGYNFVAEIANGIWDAANSLIVEAVNFMADTISSFLAPGSPPEEGPLSDIDKWGKGLIDTFSRSFSSADFSFLKNSLAPVKKFFIDEFGEAGFEPFEAIRGKLATIIEEMNRTGIINQDLFGDIAGTIGENNTELTKFLELNLELQAAQKKVADTRSEIADAEKSGFVSQGLRERLAAEEKALDAAQEAVAWQQEFLDFQKLSMDEFNRATSSAASSASKAARGAARAGTKAVKKALGDQLSAVQASFEAEKVLLKQKFDAGAISHEEYLQGLIRAEEKYVNEVSRKGLPAVLDDNLTSIANLKGEFKSLYGKAAKTAKKVGGTIGDSIIDLILNPFRENSSTIGQDIGQGAVEGIKIAMLGQPVFDDTELGDKLLRKELAERNGISFGEVLSTKIGESFKANGPLLLEKIKETIRAAFDRLSGELEESKAGKAIKAIGGILGALFGGKAIGLLVAKLAPLGKAIKGLLGVGLRFSLIGGVIYTIFTNWDEIVKFLNPLIERLRDLWGEFTGKLEDSQQVFQDAWQSLQDIKDSIPDIAQGLGQTIVDLVTGKSVRWDSFLDIFDLSNVDMTPILEIAQAIADTLQTELLGLFQAATFTEKVPVEFDITQVGDDVFSFSAISVPIIPEIPPEALTGDDLVDAIAPEILSTRLQGMADSMERLLGESPDNQQLSTFGEIMQGISTALESASTFFSELRTGLQGLSEEGQFLGELAYLFQTIRDNFKGFLGLLGIAGGAFAIFKSASVSSGTWLTAIQQIDGVLLRFFPILSKIALPLTIILAAFEDWEEVGPHLSGALAGVLRVLSGIIQVIGGIIEGDPTTVFKGIADVLLGLYSGIIELGGAIFNIILRIGSQLLELGAVVARFFGVESVAVILEQAAAGLEQVSEQFTVWVGEAKDIMFSLVGQLKTIWGLVGGDAGAFFETMGVAWNQFWTDLGAPIFKFVDDGLAAWDNMKTQMLTIVSLLVLKLIEYIQGLYDDLVGNSIIPDLVRDFLGYIVQLKDDALLYVEDLATGFIDFILGIPARILKNLSSFLSLGATLGQSIFDGLSQALPGVAEFLGEQKDNISGPIDEATGDVEESFQGLSDSVVGNSIVPDMITGIETAFRNMSSRTMQILHQWRRLIENLFNVVKKLVDGIIKKFDEFESELEDIQEAIERILSLMENLAEFDIDPIIDKLEDLEEAMKKVADVAKQVRDYLREAKTAAAAITNAVDPLTEGNQPPEFQSGAWSIPFDNFRANLHAGEMVLPSGIASNFRNLMMSIESHGIGARGVNLRAGNPRGAGGGIVSIAELHAHFPNVTSADDEQGIEESLQTLIERGIAYGQVG